MTAFSPSIEEMEREIFNNQEKIAELQSKLDFLRQQQEAQKAHGIKTIEPEPARKNEMPFTYNGVVHDHENGKKTEPMKPDLIETQTKTPKARLRVKKGKPQLASVDASEKNSAKKNKVEEEDDDKGVKGSRRPRAITLETRAALIKDVDRFTLRDVLNKYCLQELALANWANKRPILIGDFQTLERALSRINAHSIRSLPVVNKNQVVIGLIDIMDIVTSIAESLKTMGEVHTHTLPEGKTLMRNDFMSKQVSTLLETEKRKYYVASNQISLLLAVEYMVSTKQERFMIVDREVVGNVAKFSQPEKYLDGLVTQADVVRFLSQNTTLLRQEPLFQKTLTELNLGTQSPLVISHHEIASKAFIEMYEKKRDSAAVVDDSGKLVANISASDLKGLTRSNCVSLSQTLDKFLNRDWKRGWWARPITVEMNDTLFFTVLQFVASGVHRLYVVDKDGKPKAEVNHMDILKILLLIR